MVSFKRRDYDDDDDDSDDDDDELPYLVHRQFQSDTFCIQRNNSAECECYAPNMGFSFGEYGERKSRNRNCF